MSPGLFMNMVCNSTSLLHFHSHYVDNYSRASIVKIVQVVAERDGNENRGERVCSCERMNEINTP